MTFLYVAGGVVIAVVGMCSTPAMALVGAVVGVGLVILAFMTYETPKCDENCGCRRK